MLAPLCILGGVVRDPALHDEVCRHIAAWMDGLADWRVLGLAEGPIVSPEGIRSS